MFLILEVSEEAIGNDIVGISFPIKEDNGICHYLVSFDIERHNGNYAIVASLPDSPLGDNVDNPNGKLNFGLMGSHCSIEVEEIVSDDDLIQIIVRSDVIC